MSCRSLMGQQSEACRDHGTEGYHQKLREEHEREDSRRQVWMTWSQERLNREER